MLCFRFPASISVIGSVGNTKIIIRRKRGYETLVEVDIDDAIDENVPTKFVLEVTNGKCMIHRTNTNWCDMLLIVVYLSVADGYIRVFSELDKVKPVAEAHDSNPLRVKYVSFAIYEPARAQFYYDCGA